MSRREGRDSQSKRFHSRSERDASLKRPRREGKPATERTYSSSHNLEIVDPIDREKHRRQLQDALPLEGSTAPESKTWPDLVNEGQERKADGLPDGTKHSSNPTEVPRSRTYFQHDERGSAGHGGRSFSRRATENGGWRSRSDPKEHPSDKVKDKSSASDRQKKDEKTSDMLKKDEKNQPQADDNNVWKHDGYYKLEAEAPLARKRPAFREKKLPTEESALAAAEVEAVKPLRRDRPMFGSVRREERGDYHHPHGPDKLERPFVGVDDRNGRRVDASLHRGEMHRSGYQPRERFTIAGDARGRDRYNERFHERNQFRPGGFQVEKWKHDMYDEANRSPTPKNEEDQIAKVEALLAS